MQRRTHIFTVLLLLLMVTGSRAQNTNGNVLGTFVASTPCMAGTKPLPGIANDAACELMKWKVVLYGNNSNPASFTLHCTYGLSRQGSTDFMAGSKEVIMEGACTIIKGTATNPNATVYKLTDSKTGKSVSVVKLSDNVLHLLDDSMHLMIGSAAWSYTLNKTENR